MMFTKEQLVSMSPEVWESVLALLAPGPRASVNSCCGFHLRGVYLAGVTESETRAAVARILARRMKRAKIRGSQVSRPKPPQRQSRKKTS